MTKHNTDTESVRGEPSGQQPANAVNLNAEPYKLGGKERLFIHKTIDKSPQALEKGAYIVVGNTDSLIDTGEVR